MLQEVVLIKLGGSVVTHKERPMTMNKIAIDQIFKSLLSVKVPIIFVHGGGSFGHYWSVKYDMHSRSEEHTSELQSRLHLVCRLLLEKKKIQDDVKNDLYHY